LTRFQSAVGWSNASLLPSKVSKNSSLLLVLATFFLPTALLFSAPEELWWNTAVLGCAGNVGDVVVIKRFGESLIAGTTRCGLLVSKNGGLGWEEHPAGGVYSEESTEPLPIQDIAEFNGELVVAAGDQGVFRLMGAVWQRINGMPVPLIARNLIVEPATNRLFVGTQLGGLYACSALDVEMHQVLDSLDGEPITINSLTTSSRGLHIGTSLAGLLYLDAEADTLIPDNQGFPFVPISTGKGTETIDGWQIVNTLAYSVAGGMYVRGPESVVWKIFNTGIDEHLAYAFALTTVGNTVILSAGYKSALGVFTWTPPALEWTTWNAGLSNYDVSSLATWPLSDGSLRILAGTRSGTIWIRSSTDIPVSVENRDEHEHEHNHERTQILTASEVVNAYRDARFYDMRGTELQPPLATGVVVCVFRSTQRLILITE